MNSFDACPHLIPVYPQQHSDPARVWFDVECGQLQHSLAWWATILPLLPLDAPLIFIKSGQIDLIEGQVGMRRLD